MTRSNIQPIENKSKITNPETVVLLLTVPTLGLSNTIYTLAKTEKTSARIALILNASFMLNIPATLYRSKKALSKASIHPDEINAENMPQICDDAWGIVGEFSQAEDILALSKVSKSFNALFKPVLSDATKGLLKYVLEGKEDAVIEICKRSPKLLYLSKVTATDYSGREIAMTPLQAMIANGDIDMLDAVVEYIPNGLDIVRDQIKEMFPSGVKVYFDNKDTFDFGPIVDAISSASSEELHSALGLVNASFTETEKSKPKDDKELTLVQSLNRFRDQFSKRSHKDKIFNPNHLLRAFKIYDKNYDNWNLNQQDLFWRQVVGYTQRYIPACYAQAFAQGLYFIGCEREKLTRSLIFRDNNCSFYPSNCDDASGLGFEFAMHDFPVHMPMYSYVELFNNYVRMGSVVGGNFSELFNAKIEKLEEFMKNNHAPINLSSCCVVS